MVFYVSEVWINTVQHSEELICNAFRCLKGKKGIAIQFQMLYNVQLFSGITKPHEILAHIVDFCSCFYFFLHVSVQ